MKALIIPALFLTLAACGGTNSGERPERLEGLTFGTTSAAQSANGLPFAEDDSNINDLIGQVISVNAVTSQVDAATGQGTFQAEATVLEFVDGTNFTIRLDGEELQFISSRATRSNGDVLIGLLNVADFSAVLTIQNDTAPNTPEPETLFFSQTSYGFETSPETIAGLDRGTVTYQGNLSARGVLIENDDPTTSVPGEATGIIRLEADFASDTVGGFALLSLDDNTDGLQAPIDAGQNVQLDIVDTGIEGNGFVADMAITACPNAVSCSTDAQVGGVFYGPEGNEVAGAAFVDLSVENFDGTVTQFVGGGGYVGREIN